MIVDQLLKKLNDKKMIKYEAFLPKNSFISLMLPLIF